MTKQPFNTAYGTVGEFIAARQNELGKTDHEIALALGDDFEKVISLIKKGAMWVPVSMVIDLAGALEVNAADMLRLVLAETDPALLETIERVMGPVTMSAAEIELLQTLRKVAKGRETTTLVVDKGSVMALIVA